MRYMRYMRCIRCIRYRRNAAYHIWEDIAQLRRIYESRGCGFVLATMLRRPDPDLYVSDYLFEVGVRCGGQRGARGDGRWRERQARWGAVGARGGR